MLTRWLRICLICVLPLYACIAHADGLYSQWRGFVEDTDALDETALSMRYAQLRAFHREQPADLNRLKLAYLLIRGAASLSPAEARFTEVERWLSEIDDAHELTPLRDGFWRELRLQRELQRQQEAIARENTECESVRETLRALRMNSALTQAEIATCRQQVEALKRIENTLSEPVDPNGVPES